MILNFIRAGNIYIKIALIFFLTFLFQSNLIAEKSQCQSELQKKGLIFAPSNELGTVDAVLVTPPVNSILIQHWPHKDGRQPLLMDCRIADALFRIAPALKKLGITQIIGARSYHYRCIAPAKNPPYCTGTSLSLHASAMAIDIGGFIDREGVKYWFIHDWLLDPQEQATCDKKLSGKNGFLHEAVCEIYKTGVFSQHLTPNYNEAHKSHLHLDLSTQERFIR